MQGLAACKTNQKRGKLSERDIGRCAAARKRVSTGPTSRAAFEAAGQAASGRRGKTVRTRSAPLIRLVARPCLACWLTRCAQKRSPLSGDLGRPAPCIQRKQILAVDPADARFRVIGNQEEAMNT